MPGLFHAVLAGIPAIVDFVKPLIKKKKLSDAELATKTAAELVQTVKEVQSHEDETWQMFILKRATTLATVYFVIWATKQLGVTSNDILTLFGILK